MFWGRDVLIKDFGFIVYYHSSLVYGEDFEVVCNSKMVPWNLAFLASFTWRGSHVTQSSQWIGSKGFLENRFPGIRPFLPPGDFFTFPPEWMTDIRLEVAAPFCCHQMIVKINLCTKKSRKERRSLKNVWKNVAPIHHPRSCASRLLVMGDTITLILLIILVRSP